MPKKPLKILQISDLHLLADAQDSLLGVNTEFYWHQVFALANQHHPDADLLLLTGDLSQSLTANSYQRLLKTLRSKTIACLCLPGNHDDYPLMLKILNQGPVSCSKQLLFDAWQIIALNSQVIGKPGGYLAKQELDFLGLCLSQYPQLHAFICFHHHCTASGSEWMDSMQITNSECLFDLLRDYPQVQAITTGHIHQQMETEKGNIKIYSTPSSCFQFKPFSQDFAIDTLSPGYRWFKLQHNGQIESDVERLDIAIEGLDPHAHGY